MMTRLFLILALVNLVLGFLQGAAGNLDISIIHGLLFGVCLFSIRKRSSIADEELTDIRRVK